MVFCRCCHYDY